MDPSRRDDQSAPPQRPADSDARDQAPAETGREGLGLSESFQSTGTVRLAPPEGYGEHVHSAPLLPFATDLLLRLDSKPSSFSANGQPQSRP